jgi:hypothetical protein
MPYIALKDREYIRRSLDLLVEDMLEIDGQDVVTAGLANYVVTTIVIRTLKPPSGWTYSSLSKALAVFRDAEAEMRRRLLDLYEDRAIQKNGDIEGYSLE